MPKIEKFSYIRVGTQYFKIINQPLNSKDFAIRLDKWNLLTIKNDESPEVWKSIPKYDSFCIIPNHLNYERRIGNSYNKYEPFEFEPKEGEYQRIQEFLSHIFGEQLELGFDYLKLLYEKPYQILPILCLVSTERNTGKTTFLNLLKSIFKGNMTINTNEDFRSQFNSDWTNKLIIGVDEVLLDKVEYSEKLKNLSTAKQIKSESKGVDKVETDFFGKFILCTNNEEKFVLVDSNEIRYWVRKINRLENDNVNLLSEMKNEIPAFLYFLSKREMSTEKKSRMWFTKEQIYTEALGRLKKGNQTQLEKEIRILISEQMNAFGLEEISYTVTDLFDLCRVSLKTNKTQIGEALRKRFEMKPVKTPSTYKVYYLSGIDGDNPVLCSNVKKGRFYTFHKNSLFDVEDVDS